MWRVWTPYDWSNKFYSFYMVAIVSIISRCGLAIEVHCRNQPNESKLCSTVKAVTFTFKTATECFNYEGKCGMTRIEAFKKKSWLSVQLSY